MTVGSDKSTAIVPASWTKGQFTAFYTMESPDVRFEDVINITMRKPTYTVPIDPRFVETTESGTIAVCGAVPDLPFVVGASVVAEESVKVIVKASDEDLDAQGNLKTEINVTVKLTAVRRGFRRVRFGDRTREEFVANERFLGMNKPKNRK